MLVATLPARSAKVSFAAKVIVLVEICACVRAHEEPFFLVPFSWFFQPKKPKSALYQSLGENVRFCFSRQLPS